MALFLFFSTLIGFSQAQNPTGCKLLDFDSYSGARNSKKTILSSGVNLNQPNFAGHYLLFQLDYLMDTEWMVADCNTGKFIRDTLSTKHHKPKITFQTNDAKVLIQDEKPGSDIPSETHLFENEKWQRIASTTAVTQAPTITNTEPVTELTSCRPINFNSNDRARASKASLLANTPEVKKPNFAGKYLLMKAETLFQDFWLIADCSTGNFLSEVINGKIEFSLSSPWIKKFESGKEAKSLFWSDSEKQWIDFSGENHIIGSTAKLIYEALPNPTRSPRIQFDQLNCDQLQCHVEEAKKKMELDETNRERMIKALDSLGKMRTLKNIRCGQDVRKYECHFEV